jgi:hypothetical protein
MSITRRMQTPRPPCGKVTIYRTTANDVVSCCNCCRSYQWGYGMTLDQLNIWIGDHDSFFGVGRGWVMKASDILDEVFVKSVTEAIRRRNLRSPTPGHVWTTATRWDVTAVLAGHPELVGSGEAHRDFPGLPPKVVLAKAKKLLRRGVIDGCACGCRGDFEVLPPKAEERRGDA